MTKDPLERQVEDGNLFTHSALSHLAERLNRVESLLYALADLCVDKNLVVPDELKIYNQRIRDALAQQGEAASAGVVMRVDPEEPPKAAQIDCKARLPLCKAACCSLSFPLSAEEVERGLVKWELGRPYFARKDERCACVHLDKEKGCMVYDDRPRVCRTYSCERDERIWKDFENMVPNTEWIEENLRPANRRLVSVRMERF
jgi:Fe-S-cluster containining protein